MRWVVRIALGIALVLIVVVALARWKVEHQGAEPAAAIGSHAASVAVLADDYGVPTIRGRTWDEIVEAEGYAVASQRMFQMELMRRAAGGRLAALFGEKAIPIDRRRAEEDWVAVAERAYADLPPEERQAVDSYARGVNRFISENSGGWGIEWSMLQIEPEPWQGRDSLLILLTMAEELSSSAPVEVMEGRWRKAVTDNEWLDFLFTPNHPWNKPLFGTPGTTTLPARALPSEPLGASEGLAVRDASDDPLQKELHALLPIGLPDPDGPVPASNSWAYCGTGGCWLANDPHLGYGVPELWFAVRLERVDDLAKPIAPAGDEWAAGVAIPGLPGLVLGMNAYVAWSFTNTGEDVDDLLAETLSPDRTQYLASDDPEVWAPLMVKTATIVVKGAPDVHVRVEQTHRGPLLSRPGMVTDHTRQWLPLKPGMLRLPIGLPRARSIAEVNAVLDGMKAPAQNVTIVDRDGNIAYRTSGTGIRRRLPGRVPVRAVDGEWLGFEDPSQRPRLFIAKTSTAPRMLVTANQRIWVDDGAHSWADDAREERIRRVLSSSDRLSGDDMVKLQLDTESRYHALLLKWVSANAAKAPDRWKTWDAQASSDPRTFSEALAIDKALQEILLNRARKHLGGGGELPYTHRMARAWVITALEQDGVGRFGVDPHALADRLVEVAASVKELYPATNRWETQHPFVGRVPDIIGHWFALSTPEQVGYRALVRTEAPTFGASVRLIWSPGDPKQSRWSFPIGQSGHIGSKHFDDARADWFAGKPRPVF